MSAKARGVQEIKTLSAIRGSGVYSNERHVHQFQLASLELERSRRMREKNAALGRIEDVDCRLVEIDRLIVRHQAALGLLAGGETQPMTEPREAAERRRHTLRY
jgi:hypothetical protein